jgi:hypothetical protein
MAIDVFGGMTMRLRLCLLLALFSMPAVRAADIDALYTALETSDTPAVERFVTDHYRDSGISVNDTLTWEHQRFDEIVNWYNQHTEVIMLSELPKPAEVAPYWQNWAEVLTQGNWNWRSFFADDAEAAMMANFNQFLLAAHEYGHALTYRYDPRHEQRYDNEINCREYLADRLAAALLEEVAEADQRMADLKVRYRALIDEINAHIAPEYRYQVPTFAALDADCRVLHVEQPTEDSMTPYASAFFVRHALLQAADLPPLAEIYATHLLPYWRERQPPAAGLAGPVTTGARIDVDLQAESGGLNYEQRLLAFDPGGELYIIETGEQADPRPLRVRFSYGPAGAPVEVAIPATEMPDVTLGEFGFFGYLGALAMGPDRFIVMTGAYGLGSVPVVLFDVSRAPGGLWTMRTVPLEPDPAAWERIHRGALVHGPNGRIYAFVNDPAPTATGQWRRHELDPVTLAITATAYLPATDEEPVAVGPDGLTYLYGDYRIVSAGENGVAAVAAVAAVAGAGLQGFKDNADPLLAEFAISSALVHVDPDGSLQLIDYDPTAATLVRRHIAVAQ